ncbi:MAG: DUF4266 domain-containing protein [Burkholderiaceae bacterium]
MTLFRLIAFSGITAFLVGCSSAGVKPWDRGELARPDMAVSEQPLTDGLEDHTYFSKEGASGGRSFGGGGCGCN